MDRVDAAKEEDDDTELISCIIYTICWIVAKDLKYQYRALKQKFQNQWQKHTFNVADIKTLFLYYDIVTGQSQKYVVEKLTISN